MSRNNRKVIVPADIQARADAALSEQRAKSRQASEAAERNEHCRESVRAYCRATEALWRAEFSASFDPKPFLKAIHKSLVEACNALVKAGRLEVWQGLDPDEVYSRNRYVNHREMLRPAYDWARDLFDFGCNGSLPLNLSPWHL
jgi:hypothetical protein